MRKILFLFIIISVTRIGYAELTWDDTDWTGWLEIKFIQITASGNLDLYVVESPASVNCQNNTQFRATLHEDMKPTIQGRDMMHRTALAAKLSGSQVNLRYYSLDGRCWFERIQIK